MLLDLHSFFFSNDAGELSCHFIKMERTRVQRAGETNPAKIQKRTNTQKRPKTPAPKKLEIVTKIEKN
jgi:hypothetical protein